MPQKHDYSSCVSARVCALCQEVKTTCSCCGVCKRCNGLIHDREKSRAFRESGAAPYRNGRLL